MLATGRFDEFVAEFIKRYNTETDEKAMWEVWLHRVFDKSFKEFKTSLGMNEASAAPTHDEQIEAVRRSLQILNGFHPAKVGENGTIQVAGHNRNR